MNALRVHFESLLSRSSLTESLREAGLVSAACDLDGVLQSGHSRGDWLSSLVTSSPMIKTALAEAAATQVGVDPQN